MITVTLHLSKNKIASMCCKENVSYIILWEFLTLISQREMKNSHILKAFLCNKSLECCCESDISKVDFSYHSTSNQSVSLIKHFLVSANLIANLILYNVFHEGDNLSDHDAICLKLKMPSLCYAHTPTGVSYKNVCWERASDSDILVYKGKVFERLKSISVPWDALTCKSFMYKKHHNDIVTFHDCLIAAHLNNNSRIYIAQN